MRMLIAMSLTTALAACAGATDVSPVPGPARIPGVPSVELTEPWKSMSLPVEGAIVEASSATSLFAHFPAGSADDLGSTFAVLKQALVEAGWTVVRESESPTGYSANLETPAGERATLTVMLDNGRPQALVTILR